MPFASMIRLQKLLEKLALFRVQIQAILLAPSEKLQYLMQYLLLIVRMHEKSVKPPNDPANNLAKIGEVTLWK